MKDSQGLIRKRDLQLVENELFKSHKEKMKKKVKVEARETMSFEAEKTRFVKKFDSKDAKPVTVNKHLIRLPLFTGTR